MSNPHRLPNGVSRARVFCIEQAALLDASFLVPDGHGVAVFSDCDVYAESYNLRMKLEENRIRLEKKRQRFMRDRTANEKRLESLRHAA